jgi:hypothetical protein
MLIHNFRVGRGHSVGKSLQKFGRSLCLSTQDYLVGMEDCQRMTDKSLTLTLRRRDKLSVKGIEQNQERCELAAGEVGFSWLKEPVWNCCPDSADPAFAYSLPFGSSQVAQTTSYLAAV